MNDHALALIPAFNEAGPIADVIRRARPHVHEVVVIDDGSIDTTSEVARAAGATVLRHDVNRGKGGGHHYRLKLFAPIVGPLRNFPRRRRST